jgi:hypothetical protein
MLSPINSMISNAEKQNKLLLFHRLKGILFLHFFYNNTDEVPAFKSVSFY